MAELNGHRQACPQTTVVCTLSADTQQTQTRLNFEIADTPQTQTRLNFENADTPQTQTHYHLKTQTRIRHRHVNFEKLQAYKG